MAKKEGNGEPVSVEPTTVLEPAPEPTAEPPKPEPQDLPPDAGQPLQVTPPMQMPPPTDAQTAWILANQPYERISHTIGSYTNRGTLDPSGAFTLEAPGFPVVDSVDGTFGVGVPK